jgi:AAA family ATP:ADP antiporter
MSAAIRTLTRVFGLRPEEGRVVSVAALAHFLLLLSYMQLRPLRDALGIFGGKANLPWLFTATFAAMIVVFPIFGWAASRLGRARLLRVSFRVCAVVMLALFIGLRWGPEQASAYAFFVWISVFNMFGLSLMWSVFTERFAPEQATRTFGLIAFGGSLGALAGPALAALVASLVDPIWLLPISAITLELGMRCVGVVLASGPADQDTSERANPDEDARAAAPPERPPLGGNPFAGIGLLVQRAGLRGIAGYLLLMTLASTVFYFTQADIIERELPDRGDQVSFLAGIDFATNAVALTIQALLTGRLIRRLGLGWTLVSLPAVCLLAFLGFGLRPGLWTLAAAQVFRRASNYALSKPSREILYTGESPEARYKAKNVIDTLVYRGGDAISGWAYSGVTALGMGLGSIAHAMLPIVAIWGVTGWWLGRRAARRRAQTVET